LGGKSVDEAVSIAVDKFANMYLTGLTSSTNFPHTVGAFQTTCPGSCKYYHGFISKIGRFYTSTLLVSSSNLSMYGQSVTFTATVKPTATTVATPTGTVIFKDGATTLGTVTLTSSGAATLSVSNLAVSAHSITAVYGGSVDFTASTSPAVRHTVSKAKTSTTLTSTPNPSKSGQAVTFTATIKGAFGGNPSGVVTFKDGTTTIGTGAVSATTHEAKLVTSKLSVGTHNITAVYGGDVHFLTSTSAAVKQVVK
jgi:hypothetical protein